MTLKIKLVTFSLALLTFLAFSCKKEKIEEEKITFEELNSLYSKAYEKINKIKEERINKTLKRSVMNTYGNDTTISTILTEHEALIILAPLMTPTISYVQQNYDINLNDYFSPTDPNIAIAGGAALRLDALELQNLYVDTTYIEVFPLGGGMLSSTNQNKIPKDNTFITISNNTIMSGGAYPDFYDCALRAIGIEAVVVLLNNGVSSAAKSRIKKKALRKMVVKIATRTLGVIGAAIAVYELGDCMDWW